MNCSAASRTTHAGDTLLLSGDVLKRLVNIPGKLIVGHPT